MTPISYFLAGAGGLTSTQLGQISFANQGINGGTLIGAGGELVPIPEAPVWMGALAVLAFIGWRERQGILSVMLGSRHCGHRRFIKSDGLPS